MTKYNTKQCNECGEVKEVNKKFFEKSPTCKDGFRNKCLECRKAYRKKYYSEYNNNNKNEVRKRNLEYSRENKEKLKVRRKSDIEKYRLLNRINFQKRRALEREVVSDYRAEYWELALEYFSGRCAYCGIGDSKLHKEHVVPVSKGGAFVKSNIIPACQSCNLSKSNKEMKKWYKEQTFFDECRFKKIDVYTSGNETS